MLNKCPKCGNHRPFGNEICSRCDAFAYKQEPIGNIVLPPHDKYGYPIRPIPFDIQKNESRERYIFNTPLSQKCRFYAEKYINIHNDQSEYKGKKVAIGIILLAIAFISFFACGFSIALSPNEEVNLFASIFAILSFVFFILGMVNIFLAAKSPITYEDRLEMARIGINQKKLSYYVSQNVIGYCTYVDPFCTYGFSPRGDKIFFVEVDKNNIQCITYDTELAEYVLFLKEPIYINPLLGKSLQVRLQDIFDDAMLTDVLNCSLPAKKIMF